VGALKEKSKREPLKISNERGDTSVIMAKESVLKCLGGQKDSNYDILIIFASAHGAILQILVSLIVMANFLIKEKKIISRLVSGIVRPFTLFPISLNFSSLVLSRFNDHLDGVIQLFDKSFQGIPEFLQREVMRDHGLDLNGPIIN